MDSHPALSILPKNIYTSTNERFQPSINSIAHKTPITTTSVFALHLLLVQTYSLEKNQLIYPKKVPTLIPLRINQYIHTLCPSYIRVPRKNHHQGINPQNIHQVWLYTSYPQEIYRIGRVIISHYLMDRECNCYLPYKVNGKCIYEGKWRINCLLYEVNLSLCDAINISNTHYTSNNLWMFIYTMTNVFLKMDKNGQK